MVSAADLRPRDRDLACTAGPTIRSVRARLSYEQEKDELGESEVVVNCIETVAVPAPRRNILFVHQSADLYGSDKNILVLAARLDKDAFHSIVLIPEHGLLEGELMAAGIEHHVVPLAKIGRSSMSARGLSKLLLSIQGSLAAVDKVLDGRHAAVVHSNTLAVLTGAFWSRRHRVPHLWNVREMIVHPLSAKYIFSFFLEFLTDRVVTNSHAALNLLVSTNPHIRKKSHVVWNGIERPVPADPVSVREFRQSLGLFGNEVCVAMVGRINRWKGQRVLVEAANHLWAQGVRNIHFLIVGSPPPGQDNFESDLRLIIARSPARKRISLLGFRQDIWSIWDACDIVVVPSTEPEPFGMVAVEAMMAGKPVIASNHGGLAEIVVPGVTGYLVEPCNPVALSRSIVFLAENPELRLSIGGKGIERARTHFSVKAYVDNFAAHYEEMIVGKNA
jgi:glycosyltransferase involved in cell wall biosynthesis